MFSSLSPLSGLLYEQCYEVTRRRLKCPNIQNYVLRNAFMALRQLFFHNNKQKQKNCRISSQAKTKLKTFSIRKKGETVNL